MPSCRRSIAGTRNSTSSVVKASPKEMEDGHGDEKLGLQGGLEEQRRQAGQWWSAR